MADLDEDLCSRPNADRRRVVLPLTGDQVCGCLAASLPVLDSERILAATAAAHNRRD